MNNPSPYTLPWSTQPLWQAANQTLVRTLRHHRRALARLVSLAGGIRERIIALNDPMNTLCRQTCSHCRNVCCQHAHVYFDFKDLLYLHLSDSDVPERQTMARKGLTCCYLGSEGCQLPRAERPFICTWYLCPDQQHCLERSTPSVRIFVHNSLAALKTGRNRLENQYIKTTAVSAGSGYMF